jgi:hypothetical protein
MDGLQAVGSPKGDATGKMNLDAAVRAAVSATLHPGAETDSPARDEVDAPDGDAGHDSTAMPSSDAGENAGHEPAQSAETDASDTGSAASQATLDAPKVWPKEQRELFSKAPDEIKRLLLAREKAHNSTFTKNATENANHRKFSEEVRNLFTDDARQTMKTNGIDELAAIKRLVGFHDRLTRDPAGEIKALIGRLGLKPEQIIGNGTTTAPSAAPAATTEDDEFVDPQVLALKGQVGKIETFLTQALQQEQQRALASFEQEVDAFEAETDDAGTPKFPHFEAAFDQMMHLIKTDPTIAAIPATQARKRLETAYDRAVYLNPETRQKAIEADFAKRQSEAQAREAANRAKVAGTRKGSPGAVGAGVAPAKMSLDEAVRQGVASIGKR